MKILAHARAHTELLAALPALGITLAEGQSLQEALKARLETAASQPSPEAIEAGALALLQTSGLPVAAGQTAAAALKAYAGELEQAASNLATAQASLLTIQGALAKTGVKIAPDAAPADIEAAIQARVSIKASEQLAQTGTPQVDATPAAAHGIAPSAPAAQPLTGLARAIAAHKAGTV
jgi:hypothetical protein